MSTLTDVAVRNAKPKNKTICISDGDSLYLRIEPTGSKSWLFRFYWGSKRMKRSLGAYPVISLKEARLRRDRAKRLVAQGIMPEKDNIIKDDCNIIKNHLVSDYFEIWKQNKFEKLGFGTVDNRQSTAKQINNYFTKDVLPLIGDMYLNEVDRVHIIRILKQIEDRGALSIRVKVQAWLKDLFQYAKASGVITTIPVDDTELKRLFREPMPVDNNPHLTLDELPEFFDAFSACTSDLQNILGVKLLFLTGVRPGELRVGKAEQFDFEKEVWNIPADNVKQLKNLMRKLEEEAKISSSRRALALRKRISEIPPYVVPLSKQAVKVAKQLLAIRHPAQQYLLRHRSDPSQTVSENTLNKVIHRIGYEGRLTSHGIRSTISTALNEHGYNSNWIEAQLSHSDKDKIRKSYNHAEYVEPRRQMMQEWANKLEDMGLDI